MSSSLIHSRWLSFCLSGSLLVTPTLFAASPSISKPNERIPTHGYMGDSKVFQELAIADEEACIKLYQQMMKSGPNAGSVGKIAMHAKRLQRSADRLISIGEPSGHEFRLRYLKCKKMSEESFEAFHLTPPAAAMRVKAITNLEKNINKRKNKVQEVVSKADSAPFDAEKSLDAAADDHELVAGVLAPQDRAPFSEYVETENRLAIMMNEIRQKMVNDAVTANSVKMKAEMDGFLEEARTAAKSVETGMPTWRTKSISPSELLDTIFQEGMIVLTHLQKNNAAQYLLERQKSVSGRPLTIDQEWITRLSAMKSELAAIAVFIVEKDLATANESQALERIAQHASVLGKYAHRIRTDEWIKGFDEALVKAANSRGIGPKVTAYHTASQELLAWRERFANKQEAALSNQVKSLPEVMGQVAISPIGYIANVQGTTGAPQFYYPTYEALPAVAERLGKGQPAIVKNVVRLDTETATFVSRWDNYIYAMLPKTLVNNEAATQLEQSLMVDDSHPALSVRAASAIYSAKRGDGLTVGGMIEDVAVEGALSRALGLQDSSGQFLGIDAPPSFPRSLATPSSTASLRATMTAVWYRHRYFTVQR